MNRAVINGETTFKPDFLDVAIAQAIRNIPSDTLQYNVTMKVSATE